MDQMRWSTKDTKKHEEMRPCLPFFVSLRVLR